jgi:hypothetical protein
MGAVNLRSPVIALVSAIVLLYPLSMGPAYWCQKHHSSPTPAQMKSFYAPVIWLADTAPPLENLLEVYLRLWE